MAPPGPDLIGPQAIVGTSSFVKRRALYACAKWLDTHVEDTRLVQYMCRGGALALLWHLMVSRSRGA